MVVLAAERLGAVMPMMMTPSGTLQPARAFIIGAGVAGLQAIATAKRLGARVEAFDTRPVVEEQVKSLGAKFVKVDLGETGQTDQGYAQELTPEQLAKQRELMADTCAHADIVITTAQLFGRKAPVVVSADVLKRMKAGSIIVDYAVESGGNVEGSVAGEEIQVNGVTIIGLRNIPGCYAVSASSMYANNLYNYVDEFWDDGAQGMKLDREDEIIAGSPGHPRRADGQRDGPQESPRDSTELHRRPGRRASGTKKKGSWKPHNYFSFCSSSSCSRCSLGWSSSPRCRRSSTHR